MDLTTNHGTIAASFEDGSFLEIARVEANDQYKKTMRHFASLASMHPHPPCNDGREDWGDAWRQFVRRCRKSIGLPASEQVGVLAEMVTALRERAETLLEGPVEAISLTFPHMYVLYDEDVNDIFEYLKLQERPWKDLDDDDVIIWHTSSIWAGHGLRLCSNYVDFEAYWQEMLGFEEDTAISIGLEDNTLMAAKATLSAAVLPWEPRHHTSIDWFLGWEHHDSPGYWIAIQARLFELLQYFRDQIPDPNLTIMLYGEHGDAPQLLKTVQTALAVERYPRSAQIWTVYAATVAARGAAELAKRGLPTLGRNPNQEPPNRDQRCQASEEMQIVISNGHFGKNDDQNAPYL